MKTRRMSKRFSLNKHTVSDLTTSEQANVHGGLAKCEATQCKSTSLYFESSGVYIVNTRIIPTEPETSPWAYAFPCHPGR